MKLAAALLICLLAAPASATTWRKVETVKGYEGMRAEMQHLVDADPDNHAQTNHLCVVVEDNSDDPKNHPTVPILAYVHWRERAYLFAFDQTAFPPIDDASIWGGATLNLKTDVVATEKQIGGSSKLVTKAYVDRIINACALHGESVVLEKHHGR